MRHCTPEVGRKKAKQIILNTEPSLTKKIVDGYTDSELREWMHTLGFYTSF